MEAEPFRSWSGAVPVNLSIKNAPDAVVQRLRERAERHHRSLQGELMAIIEAAARDEEPATPAAILAEVRRLGVGTPAEAVGIIRADRDGRQGRRCVGGRGAAVRRVGGGRDRGKAGGCAAGGTDADRLRAGEHAAW